MGGRHVAEAVPAEHLVHEGGRRLGVEHEIHLRLRRGVVGKRVVEQVVEDAAIQVGGRGELVPQPLGRLWPGTVAAAGRQPGELRRIGRHVVRLPVGQDLEPMLHGPQQRVCAFQDLSFLVGECARGGEAADGLERVAGAHMRHVSATQQLEELDREFDVADAAATGLEITIVGTFALGAMLDAAFERLDAADVGPRKPAPIDPGLEVREQLRSERLVAADDTGLHPGLPFPRATELVVMIERG